MKEKIIELLNQKDHKNLISELKKIKKLDLSNSLVTDEQVTVLSTILQDNNSVYSINLKKSKIGDDGAKAILKMLELNHRITILMIQDNIIKNSEIKIQIANLLLRNNSERNTEISERNAKIAVELKEAEEEKEDLKQNIKELQEDAEKEKENFVNSLTLVSEEKNEAIRILENQKTKLDEEILQITRARADSEQSFNDEIDNLNLRLEQVTERATNDKRDSLIVQQNFDNEINNLNLRLKEVTEEAARYKQVHELLNFELSKEVNDLNLQLKQITQNVKRKILDKETEFRAKLDQQIHESNSQINLLKEKIKTNENNLTSYVDKAEKDLTELREYRSTLKAQNEKLLTKEQELQKELDSIKQSNEIFHSELPSSFDDYPHDVTYSAKPLGCDIL